MKRDARRKWRVSLQTHFLPSLILPNAYTTVVHYEDKQQEDENAVMISQQGKPQKQ